MKKILFGASALIVLSAHAADCSVIKAEKNRLKCYDAAAKTSSTAPEKPTETAENIEQSKNQVMLLKSIEKAKMEVIRKMKDPDSVQFRNLIGYGKEGRFVTILCGEVNAKNSYGGFIGFTPFWNVGGTGLIADSKDNKELYAMTMADTCKGEVAYRQE